MSNTQWALLWVVALGSWAISLTGLFFDYREWRARRRTRKSS